MPDGWKRPTFMERTEFPERHWLSYTVLILSNDHDIHGRH